MNTSSVANVFRIALLIGCAAGAQAQDLRMIFVSGGAATSVPDGGAVRFSAGPGQDATGTFSLLNVGASSVTITGIDITGSTDFALSGYSVPAALAPEGLLNFTVQYLPRIDAPAAATVKITVTGPTGVRTYTILLAGTVAASGSGPNFTASYTDPLTGNALALAGDSAISLPPVTVGGTTSVTISLSNRGAVSGAVYRVSLTGALAFQLRQLPLLPANVASGASMQFAVQLAPDDQKAYSAILRIDSSDKSWTIQIQGSGVGPAYAYSVLGAGGSTYVLPGGAIPFSDTPVGEIRNTVLRVTNTGTAQGQISGVTLTEGPFRLSDAPFDPFVLKPGDSVDLTFSFNPQTSGSFSARVRIGSDAFTLSGVGVGATLGYSYVSADLSNFVAPGGSVALKPTAVGEKSTSTFTIRNTGNGAAVFTVAFLRGPSAFQLDGLPALPFTLDAGSTLVLSVLFTPDSLGTVTATLAVNDAAFSIAGTGLAPSRLPQYRFEGPSGTQDPLQQPTIGITLAEAFPFAINGTLTLNFVSDVFGSNPAVQFSTGGQTAAFTIPAGSTRALFGNAQTGVRLQTGTVAGELVITPAFRTEGGLDLTPPVPDRLSLTLIRAVPQLLEAHLANRTTSGFSLTMTGFTTTRSLSQLQVRLNARTGVQLDNATLTVNLVSPALVWFQSAGSAAFGGLYSISLPVLLQGGNASEDQTTHIESVAVTVSNELGGSNTITVPLP